MTGCALFDYLASLMSQVPSALVILMVAPFARNVASFTFAFSEAEASIVLTC